MIAKLHLLMLMLNKTFSCINYGGCGAMALQMFELMSKNGFECRISWVDWEWRVGSDRNYIVRLESNDPLCHIITEFKINGKWYTLDAELGCLLTKDYLKRTEMARRGFLTKQNLIEQVDTEWRWNDMFDRSQINSIYQFAESKTKQIMMSFNNSHQKVA